MSARKTHVVEPFEPVTIEARQTRLMLAPDAVMVRKNGIEFRSPVPFPAWAEMTVSMECPQTRGKINCHGIVVGCSGNKHIGYVVSMLFTSLSRQSQTRLNSLASAQAL